MGDGSDRYERFAAALKAELGEAHLDEAPPDLSRLDEVVQSERRSRPARIVWAVAAAAIVLIGFFSYPTIDALHSRRLINTENQEFVGGIFERSLFDTANAVVLPLRESSWFDADEITAELEI